MRRSIELLVLALLVPANFVHAASDSIRELTLDEHTVYTIPVGLDRVTTISFPGPISAIDAAQVTADTKTPAQFQIAHTRGAYFFSVRALNRKAGTNLNLRWNRKTYVLELIESPKPLYSVIFTLPPDRSTRAEMVKVTPQRLIVLLDKARAYPLLKLYHPEAMTGVEFRSYVKEPKVIDYKTYEIRLDEVYRFNNEDTLVFLVRLRNKTDQPLLYAPDGFSLRVGERTYHSSIADASGTIPPRSEAPAYFAVTGTPDGGRNDLSIKNDFTVILEAAPAKNDGLREKPEDDEP